MVLLSLGEATKLGRTEFALAAVKHPLLFRGAVWEAAHPLIITIRVGLEDTVVLRSIDQPQRSLFLSRGTTQTVRMLDRNDGVVLAVNEKNRRHYAGDNLYRRSIGNILD